MLVWRGFGIVFRVLLQSRPGRKGDVTGGVFYFRFLRHGRLISWTRRSSTGCRRHDVDAKREALISLGSKSAVPWVEVSGVVAVGNVGPASCILQLVTRPTF